MTFHPPVQSRKTAGIFLIVYILFSTSLVQSSENHGKKGARGGENESSGVIVALGDSLTEGYGMEKDQSYPSLLSRKLEKHGFNYRVVNAGVSGETSAGALARVSWIMNLKPDLIILETGANDGLRGLDPERTKKNIEQIIRRFKRENVTVILAGMKMFQSLGEEYANRFNAIYPSIAESENVDFIPFFLEGVAGKRELNLSDGIHPNEKGYRIIVDNIFPYVIKNLKRGEGRKSSP